jgi:hypothetical protein
MLDARVLDVDVLDGYLIDLLWRPLLLLLRSVPPGALRGASSSTHHPHDDVADDSSRTATTILRTPSIPSNASIFLGRWIRKLSSQERIELLRLGTLLVAGTTPATNLLGLQWKKQQGTTCGSRNNTAGLLPSRRLWGYCLLRAAAVALRRYHGRVKRMLSDLHPSLRLERGDGQQLQRWKQLQFQVDALRIVHKILAACRLAVLFGATLWTQPQTATSKLPVPVPSPNKYGLAMLLSGSEYQDHRDINEGGGQNSTRRLLHVDYAHRRWLWKEGSAAVRLLLAGVLSSAVLREAWQPLLRRWYETCRDSVEGGIAACLPQRSPNRTDSDAVQGFVSSKEDQSVPRSCPLCGTSPVRIPVRADCGHVYCYVCLYKRSLRRVTGGTKPLQHQQGDHNRRLSTSPARAAAGKDSDASVGPFRCRVCRNPVAYAVPIP